MERLHASPHPTPADRRDLDPYLDRVEIAGPGGPGVRWTAINPRAFPPPRSLDHWASTAVLGETHWANRKEVPAPPRHRVAPNVLGAVSALGPPFIAWGLVVRDTWIVLFGLAVQMAGKIWFIDRMPLLYDDVAPPDP
jgi:hypothetical protein